MTTLYIIGNGFDIWHGLPTKYCQFYEYAKETLDKLELYFVFPPSKDCPWHSFEQALGLFDWRLLYEAHDHTSQAWEDFRLSEAFGLEDDLRQQADNLVTRVEDCFHEWIEQIDVSEANKQLSFGEFDLFLNFNYTSTLQDVYGVNCRRVLHIHGNSNNADQLVFGHCMTMEVEPDLDENGDSNRTMLSDAQSAAMIPFFALQKKVESVIAKYRAYFEALGSIKTIRVIGHSLSDADLPYFAEIAKNAVDAKWEIWCYHPEDEDHHRAQLRSVGVSNSNIAVCKYP